MDNLEKKIIEMTNIRQKLGSAVRLALRGNPYRSGLAHYFAGNAMIAWTGWLPRGCDPAEPARPAFADLFSQPRVPAQGWNHGSPDPRSPHAPCRRRL